METSLLYLSGHDIAALAITPGEARQAVLAAFADHGAGRNVSLPKASIGIGPGHGFQAMASASAADGIATLKWVAMAPVGPGQTVPGINGLICVSDYASGLPLAVLDGNSITLIRTAAMSAAAAACLAPAAPRTLGFVGCGLQAHAHLDAFLDLYPGLERVVLMSRSRASAERVAAAAEARGLATAIVTDADALLAEADIAVSMVPGAPGLEPFLDARRLPPASFAAAVDIGRSWLPEHLPAFDVLATDSLAQSTAPYDVDGNPVGTVEFGTDLVQLAAGSRHVAGDRRSLFCFRGFAIADLALAGLAVRKARAAGAGISLPR